MENTIWVIVPSIVAIIFAARTKKVFVAILLANLTGLIMLYRENFIFSFVDVLLEVMADPVTGWIIMITCLFGSFLAILEKSGGAEAFTNLISKYADTQNRTLFITLILGLVLFIDEYLNVLTIGTAMRKVTDKNKIPREMLAYVINSTSTPICVLLPFSTWAIFFIGLLDQEGIVVNGSAIEAYIQTIPYMFYAWITVLMVPLVITKTIPALGAMKKAWVKIDKVEFIYNEDDSNTEVVSSRRFRDIANFIIPLTTVIVVTLMSGINLIVGIISGLIVAFIMYIGQKIISFDEYMEAFWEGFNSMIIPLGIVIMAFCFKEVNDQLGLSIYILNTVKPVLSAEFLPAVTFILVATLAFATGTLWGLVAIVLPIVMTLSGSLGVDVFLVCGAVFSGAVFGSHACFYSDVVVLSARATEIEPVDHVLSLLPYALIGAILSAGGYIIMGIIAV